MVAVSIMLAFESLGGDGEFGRLQSALGFEPPGALRFCEAPFEGLVTALETDFAGLSDPGAVTIEADAAGTGHVAIPAYGFRYEAALPLAGVDRRRVLSIEERRVRLLFGKLAEVLRAGERILVRKGPEAHDPAARARLLAAVRRHGACPLLMVGEGAAVGQLEVATGGLLIGEVGFFAPADEDSDAEGWAAICALAMRAVSARVESGTTLGMPGRMAPAMAAPVAVTEAAPEAAAAREPKPTEPEPTWQPVVDRGPVEPAAEPDWAASDAAETAPVEQSAAITTASEPVARDVVPGARIEPALPAPLHAQSESARISLQAVRDETTATQHDDSLVPLSMMRGAVTTMPAARSAEPLVSPPMSAPTAEGARPAGLRGRLPPLRDRIPPMSGPPVAEPPVPAPSLGATSSSDSSPPAPRNDPTLTTPPPVSIAPPDLTTASAPVMPPPVGVEPPRLEAVERAEPQRPAPLPPMAVPVAPSPDDAPPRPVNAEPARVLTPPPLSPPPLSPPVVSSPPGIRNNGAGAPLGPPTPSRSSIPTPITMPTPPIDPLEMRDEDLPDLLRVSGLVLAYRAILPEWRQQPD